uniref:PH domain-containing protein n=1 Tax=Tanacetum cinerariifolium TaxID=118510 RepID=A0A6L2JAB4_TANCI|nr:hypothetical protein [Tanacetum cinerariifolium]
MDTPVDFSNFLMNRLRVDTLTPKLLAGPTYELMKGSCKSLIELEYQLEEVYKAITDQLDWVNPEFYGFAVNRESARDVYSKHRIIAVIELKIVEWHNYKHMDWIIVRKDNDKLYMFKEGDFKRLRIQDIKDMLLLLVQGKLTNLTVEERFAFNISLRMFTRSIVIQRGFIYQSKDKKNRSMWIDELHKFSDGTLTNAKDQEDHEELGEDQTMALQPHSSGVKVQDLMLDHQDKDMMKAQVHMSKSSAISDKQALPQRKHYC